MEVQLAWKKLAYLITMGNYFPLIFQFFEKYFDIIFIIFEVKLPITQKSKIVFELLNPIF